MSTPKFVILKGFEVDAGPDLDSVKFRICIDSNDVVIEQDGDTILLKPDRIDAFIWALKESTK